MKKTKDDVIRFRVTEQEKQTIEKIAIKKGFKTTANFVRYKLGLSYEAPAKIKL